MLHNTHAVWAAPGQQLSLRSFLFHPFKFIKTIFCLWWCFSFFHGSPSFVNSYRAAICVMLELHGNLAAECRVATQHSSAETHRHPFVKLWLSFTWNTDYYVVTRHWKTGPSPSLCMVPTWRTVWSSQGMKPYECSEVESLTEDIRPRRKESIWLILNYPT